jgi:hypothetical protein
VTALTSLFRSTGGAAGAALFGSLGVCDDSRAPTGQSLVGSTTEADVAVIVQGVPPRLHRRRGGGRPRGVYREPDTAHHAVERIGK